MELSEMAQKIYENLYDRFWRITNSECQINDYSLRGIAHVSLADLGQFGLEPDQAMEVQRAVEELREAGKVRRLTEEEETTLIGFLRDEGQHPREFLESKDYLLFVGPQ